jgi:sugar-specific transcriptional regulator TrmB
MIKESVRLSLELVIDTLVSLGLKRIDAEVYIFLAKKGPHRGKDIANALKITKQQLYPSLKNLQNKGIVKSTLKRPALFSAVPIEKVLSMFLKTRTEENQCMIQNKEQLLSSWKATIKKEIAKS